MSSPLAAEGPKPGVNRHVRISTDVVWSNVDADLVLFDSSTGEYHALNHSASDIWRLLAQGHSIGDVLHTLAGATEHRDADVERDILEFVDAAVSTGLLVIGEASLADAHANTSA